MNESSSITEAVTQPLFLCPICLRKMHRFIGFDPLERYRGLLEIIKQLRGTVLKACSSTRGDCSTSERTTTKDEREHDTRSNDLDDRDQRESSSSHSIQTCKEVVTIESDIYSQHSERFEDAIGWLENVLSSLGRA